MDFFETIEALKRDKNLPGHGDFLFLLEDELQEALGIYWKTASGILEGSGTRLMPPSDSYFNMKNNFFSALFLYSYHRAGIPQSHGIMYAAINQCLRGIVTGCDNILDDEYKKTLDTDLPEGGTRFRSVLDIMVSDRVIFNILLNAMEKESLSREAVLRACDVSLHGLLASGVQEATEESGITRILPPEEVLRSVHHYKTGLLFQAPWAVPRLLEGIPSGESMNLMMKALYDIGMGCQILDDLVDIRNDIQKHRHNYIFSLLYHGQEVSVREHLDSLLSSKEPIAYDVDLLTEFPHLKAEASHKALVFLDAGFRTLFDPMHHFLVEPAIIFVSQRIGAGLVRFE
jgi:hypothetical protein